MRSLEPDLVAETPVRDYADLHGRELEIRSLLLAAAAALDHDLDDEGGPPPHSRRWMKDSLRALAERLRDGGVFRQSGAG